jgi:hypothetical protein
LGGVVMKKISLLSLILCAGCMDWITVIPDDFVVAEAGPLQQVTYQRDAPCHEGDYAEDMTVCMRFNGNVTNARSLEVEAYSAQGPTYETLAGGNQAFNFSADNYLRVVPDQADLYTTAFTLAAWVKPKRHNQDDSPFTVFSSQFTDTEGRPQGPFRLEIEEGKPKVIWARNGGGEPQTLRAFGDTGRMLPDDGYTHLMVVFDFERPDDQMRLYVDGELTALAAQTEALWSRDMDLEPRDGIGGHLNYNPDETPFAFFSLEGAIDDLRIWNKAQPASFLAFEAGRFVERFASQGAVAQLNCNAVLKEFEGTYVAQLTAPCTLTSFPSPQAVQSIKFRVGVAESVGTPVGDGPSLEFVGGDTSFRVFRFEDQNGTPTFAMETNEEQGPATVAGCDVPQSGGAAPEMTLNFDWANRDLELVCDESRTVVKLPAGMQGVDRLRVNPGNLLGSEFWIDDIIWEL